MNSKSVNITVFNAKNTKSKVPMSPFDDKTFIFETLQPKTNLEAYSLLVSHFILNIPLNIQKPIRELRTAKALLPFFVKTNNYILLDFDDVKSEYDKQQILEYFKDFKCIIGESRSYDGFSKFNMKGLLFIENTPSDELKNIVTQIGVDLIDKCTFDPAVVRRATLNAPINKLNIFLNNEDGELFKYEKESTLEYINSIKSEYIETSSDFKIDDEKLNSLEADTIETLCLKVFKNMGFEAIKTNTNGSISFKHPSENKSVGGYFWFKESPYNMHHNNNVKSVNIFETVKKLDIAKTLLQKDINYENEFLYFNTDTDVLTIDEKYITINENIENKIEKFLNNKNGLLSIRSPMGTAKSTLINHIIEECHNIDMKVLIVTNRISVAQDFAKKYNLKLYNKDTYEIGDSLVVQFDSLWKYDIKFFDIVIMDEFISLMSHSRNNLNNNSFNISKFFGCFNKKLVIADAFLTGYENFLLNNKQFNLHMIDNVWRDPVTLYDYKNLNAFIDSIGIHALKHKITVSSTSIAFIHALKLFLKNKGLKVVDLTAETQQKSKELIYDLFEKEDHDKWDVLIYSPTLTVGVSNLNNNYYHFHYDGSLATDVISSIQMLKRTRKAKEIHLFVKDRINYLKTTYNSIRDEYMNNLGKNLDNHVMFETDDYGNARLSNNGKKAIKIDVFKNILEYNHRKAMFWLLKYHFRYEPRVIDTIVVNDPLSNAKNILKNDKDIIVKMEIEKYLNLSDTEKHDMILGKDVNKYFSTLVDIEENMINDMDKTQKQELFEICMKDSKFIQKCKYYKVTNNFTKKIWNESDITYLINKSVMNYNTDDLNFYNVLLDYGQKDISEKYISVEDKQLKFILTKCGYETIESIGLREFGVPPTIKKYYQNIK